MTDVSYMPKVWNDSLSLNTISTLTRIDALCRLSGKNTPYTPHKHWGRYQRILFLSIRNEVNYLFRLWLPSNLSLENPSTKNEQAGFH